MKKDDLLSLTVKHFNDKGQGVAFHNEKKITIPYALPEERVEALLLTKKRSEWVGRLQTVVEKSAYRAEPICSHTGICGGCQWQQLSYKNQLQQKEQWIRNLFSFCERAPLPILACDKKFNYRNKMEFSFSQSKSGEKFLGLQRQGSQRVENIGECHSAPQWFSQCLQKVRQWWIDSPYPAFNPRKGEGLLRTLTFREGISTGEKMGLLTIHHDLNHPFLDTDKSSFIEALIDFLKNFESFTVVLKTHIAIKGRPTEFKEEPLVGKGFIEDTLTIDDQKLHFKISPDAFFQPNPTQAEKLFTTALRLSALNSNDTVLDLYSGTGVLGLVASLKAKKVVGIELNSSAVKDAMENIAINGVRNFEMVEGDVGATLKHLNLQHVDSLTVFLDPPRSGLNEEALQQVLGLSPQKIVYVSCNPRTQAPNVQVLIEKGYSVEVIQPVDQFPHTYHIENIVILTKKVQL